MLTFFYVVVNYLLKNHNFIRDTMIKEADWDIVERFMELLDEAIHDAKDMLIERFDWICS